MPLSLLCLSLLRDDKCQRFFVTFVIASPERIPGCRTSAYLVGSPEEVAEKILRHTEALGGVSRLTFQMDNPGLTPEQVNRSIELIGTKVLPLVNGSVSGK